MMNFLLTKTPLIFLTQSFWRDEAFSYLMAAKSIPQILFSTAKDFSPPLYYILLNIWMMIFGNSEIALRAVSLIFFYATIYIVDHLLTDVLKIKSRWRYLYLLLIAINPFLIYYAAEARMYTMSVFFATLSWYAFLSGKRRLHIISSALGLYTHYFTALALVSQVVYSYIRKQHKQLMRDLILVALLFAPWLIFVILFHGSSDDSFWIMRPTIRTIEFLPGILLTGFEQSFRQYAQPLTVLTLACYSAVVVALRSMRHHPENKDIVLYLLLWAFLPALISIVVSLVKPVFLPRYIIFSVTGLSLLLIFSLEQLKPSVRALLFIVIMLSLVQYNMAQIKHRTKGDVRAVVKEIRSSIQPSDAIYVESELDFHTVQYYFDPSRVFVYRKTYQEIPQYVGKVLISDKQVVSTLPQYPRKAYIIHSDLSFDVQSMN